MLALKPNLDVGEVSSGVQSLKLSGDRSRSGGKKVCPRKDERSCRSGGKEVSGDGIPRKEVGIPLIDHKGNPVLDCNGKPLRGKYNLVPEDPNVPFDIDQIKLTDSDDEMINELVDQTLKAEQEAREMRKYHTEPLEDPSPTFDEKMLLELGEPDDPAPPFRYPDPFECKICGRPHFQSACPYLMELPPNGKLLDTTGYTIICHCGNELPNESTPCPQLRFHPGYPKRVVPKCTFMFTVPILD